MTSSKRNKIHVTLLSLGRHKRRRIVAFIDSIALTVALWSAFALRTGDFWPSSYLSPSSPLFLLVPLTGVLLFERLGLYREVIRFLHARVVQAVLTGVGTLTLLLYACAHLFQIEPFPRAVPLIFALASLLYVGGTRLFIRIYYQWLLTRVLDRKPVLIYGAGGNGVQLAMSLAGGAEYIPVGFVDDDPSLWKSMIGGIEVFPPSDLEGVIKDQRIDTVLVALPELLPSQRAELFETLAKYRVRIKTMPSLPEIISGAPISNLRDIKIEDLLGRLPVEQHLSLISEGLVGKCICVTGAGGSIGSEIARQALRGGVSRLVLVDSSEYNLYTINEELNASVDHFDGFKPQIIMRLASVQDQAAILSILQEFQVDTLYHAAAYKHVPIVESNVVEGIKNNILGTYNVAIAAKDAGVKRFILISTDKAVRPTNVMGATKRFAELIVQSQASRTQAKGSETRYSIVRFGNVLGSSGSVVPLFRRQIKSGGPLTVTHPDINRYFMTIQEAASLVIQASALSQGGEVFVLDMGEPVKIVDLARRMIKLSGYEVKGESDSGEGIEICFTGLRPGEKLYEELLIGDSVSSTGHPKIMRAFEQSWSTEQFKQAVQKLENAVAANNVSLAIDLLKQNVDGYHPTELTAIESVTQPSKIIPFR